MSSSPVLPIITNKANMAKLDPANQPELASSSEFVCTPSNVTATTNTAIDLILETINTININSNEHHRAKLYNAIEVLRTMTSNNGNRTHIHKLPDDCLVLIFSKRFSLQKMISSFRLVCTRWKDVVESLVCAPKRSLKLFGSLLDVREYGKKLLQANLHADEQFRLPRIGHHDHDLVLASSWNLNYDPSMFCSLGKIFPNVQHLVVGVHDVIGKAEEKLALALSSFPGLVRLTLFFKFDVQFEVCAIPEIVRNVFHLSIKITSPLKYLDLLGDWLKHHSENIANNLCRVLPELEHLSMENANLNGSRLILSQLGPNLKSLRLDQFENFQDSMKSLLKPEVTKGVIELRLSNITDLNIVTFVCGMFPYLKRLELNFKLDQIQGPLFPLNSDLITALNQLPNLQSLSLENLRFNLAAFIPTTFPSSPVKSLHLSNFLQNQIGTDGGELIRALAKIFPLTEQLDYQFYVPVNKRTFVYRNCKMNRDYALKQFANLRDCRLYYRHCWHEYIGRHQVRCYCAERFKADSGHR